jgi:hypothetical protein
MRASQPLAQSSCSFVWRWSIEGHQRHRAPWNPDDAGAPAVGRDSGHLDQVGVPADQFFEAMDGDAHVEAATCVLKIEKRRELYLRGVADQAKRVTKAHAHPRRARTSDGGPAEINSVCHAFHRNCTVRPQDFNRLDTESSVTERSVQDTPVFEASGVVADCEGDAPGRHQGHEVPASATARCCRNQRVPWWHLSLPALSLAARPSWAAGEAMTKLAVLDDWRGVARAARTGRQRKGGSLVPWRYCTEVIES